MGKQVISGGELNGGQIISDVVMGRIGGQSKVFSDANIKVKENRLDRVMRIAKNDPKSVGRAQNVKDASSSIVASRGANQVKSTAVVNALQSGSNKVRSILNAGSNSRSIVTPKIQMAQDNTRVITSIIDLK